MAVSLVVSETLDGAAVSDAIAGAGGQVGVDVGSCVNSQFAPLTDKPTNLGHQDLFLSHDGVAEITDVGFFIANFDTTGYTYGGAASAAADYASLISLGNLSDEAAGSKNNGNDTSGGFWMDMDGIQAAPGTTQFDLALGKTFIFGNNGTDGIDLASAFDLITDANVYNAPPETDATTPEAGKIGPATNTVLGDAAHVRCRLYLPSTHPDGGIFQWATVAKYSFTA